MTRWAWGYSAFLIVITSLPYMLAASSSQAGWNFTGFLIAVEDGNSYLAKMLTGHEGAWLFRSPYSTTEQAGVLAFLPYILVGKLSNGTHAQLVILYHLMRIAAIPALVLSVYRFSAFFIKQEALRRWAVIIATIGGGLGWLLVILGRPEMAGSLPLEFYSPETFGFLALYGLPHLTLARAAMLLGFVFYLQDDRGWRAGGAILLAGLIHSPELLSAYAALGAHGIAIAGLGIRKADWAKRLGRAVVPSIPLAAYLGFRALTDPFLQAWNAQNLVLSPHPILYLLAFGILLPPAYLGARALVRGRQASMLFPVAWAIVIPALAFAPVNIQRRLPEGGWVALAVLAAVGIGTLARDSQRIARVAVASLALPSSLLILAMGLELALNPREPAFHSDEEVGMLARLRAAAEPNSVVLAAFETSNAVPAWAPLRVVAGHGPETSGLAELQPRIEGFFDARGSDFDRMNLIEEQQVSFVVFGPRERVLGDWNPNDWDCLSRADAVRGYEIYRTCLP